MWTTIRQAYMLVGRDRPGRWIMLVVLAIVVSGLEMLGALMVYALLSLVADPGAAIELPVAGDLRGVFSGADQRTLILGTVAAMAVFFVVRSIVKIGSKYAQSRVAYNAGAKLSIRLLEGYLLWPYRMHLTRPTAELIRNGHHAVNELVKNVLLPLIQLVAAGVLVAGLLTVLLVLAPLATAAAVVVIGSAALLVLFVVQPRIKDLGRINHDESKTTLHTMQSALFGIRDVKVFGRERFFAGEYGDSRRRMAQVNYLKTTLVQVPPVIIEMALLAFILAYFAITVVTGGATQEALSVLGLFAYAGLRLQPPIQQIMSGVNNLKFSAAPLEDIYADVALMEARRPPRTLATPLVLRQEIALEHLEFTYESAARPALRDIDLTIARGEQVGICGPTGSGKTTLIDVITGLLEPSRGRVAIDGVDLRGRERNWQANLGIVPQMVFLTDDTLRRNIALGVPEEQIDADAVAEAVRLAQLEEFVSQLPAGLETTVGERGVRVSGGQRQRIAIARALYRRPDVLIFDEGTSALDSQTEAHMMDAIEGLRGERTIFLVAHRLTTVRNCDRIIFLENGEVTGLGTFEDLCRSNRTFRAMAGTA